jgi:hypothetical protein
MLPLFDADEAVGSSPTAATKSGRDPQDAFGSDLEQFFRVDAQDDRLDELASILRKSDLVQAAYVKPAGEPPSLNAMAPSGGAAPPAGTPSFTALQGYLDPAPAGIDARFAWTKAGGKGDSVKVLDLEWSWESGHEDLQVNKVGVRGGTAFGDTNHGTAVAGAIAGDENAFGVTGVAPNVELGYWAFSMATATAIQRAAMLLSPGDIILLEIHRPGPFSNFQSRADQVGYIAIEWWLDDLRAIQFAARRGVVVIEAAGNGRQSLDDPRYDIPGPNFPASWQNPYRRNAGFDSGAVLVGAGAPPPGTHGVNHGPDRSRLDFSNYGRAVDAQGWGREVTTCGYGDLQSGKQTAWYTNQFSGTSSASPIVVGSVACVQGALAAAGRRKLTPPEVRAMLRQTGSPQTDSATGPAALEHIGNRPDLRQMIAWAERITSP